jgi:hypothetical protein
MHTLEFNFRTITNEQAIDALVYSMSIELWLKHSIESHQTRAGQLHFEKARDCMVAQLVLADPARYEIVLK